MGKVRVLVDHVQYDVIELIVKWKLDEFMHHKLLVYVQVLLVDDATILFHHLVYVFSNYYSNKHEIDVFHILEHIHVHIDHTTMFHRLSTEHKLNNKRKNQSIIVICVPRL